MWSTEEIIVISDLHLAAERGKGLFQVDEQLAKFLGWVHENIKHCQLVLNGDSFDFLVGKRETAIGVEDAAIQATEIAENHPEVFEALGRIANSELHELVILGGNHDPELSLSSVQKRISLHLNPSCAHSPVQWLTNGEAVSFDIGEVKVLIEHGDQYDSWNWIDHEALRKVVCLASRNVAYGGFYKSPPGSQLVINRFNPLRDRFPWLATLQPLSPAILPLALEVILPTLSKEDRAGFLAAAREFCNYSLRSLSDEVLRKLKPEREYWAEAIDERQLFIEWLDLYERDEDTWGLVDDAVEQLTRMLKRLRNILTEASLRKVFANSTFYDVNVPDPLVQSVTRLIDQGTNLIVHGHTHSAKAYAVGQGLYLNSGTWGQFTRLPSNQTEKDTWGSFLTGLREGRSDTFCRPTFIRISRLKDITTATLFEWQNGGAEQRSAWWFANNCWQKEG